MQIALISDIHSNYDALTAVIERIDALGPDRIYCAGDVVGYGAQPCECIRMVRDRNIASVTGNHDSAVAGITPTDYFNSDAHRAVVWTRAVLSAEEVTWLENLPLTIEEDDFVVFHGSLEQPESFSYILSLSEAAAAFALLDRPVGFFGHSHAPLSFLRRDNVITPAMSDFFGLSTVAQSLINVGSVGQPRDLNPLAAFAVYDIPARTVRMERVEYDVAAAAGRILGAGLPESSAHRLFLGR